MKMGLIETDSPGRGHKYDDEGTCIYCRLDGAEASYYSQRGYAHEYPDYFADCPKAPGNPTGEQDSE